ncbi:type IV pilus assembly PilZ [Thermodesulfatator indicus DSM 15286]|uniref:Type IV pilus assembly PilZ n=1 Tax=Thermodesulfatator indicus (strain DSM 15286 / JCM 11887 / CIR29812) TaxID=667014 RepID=F8ADF1_THEID|nr:PilZ domain-containing protein [Thermodesulfatator indicus]AEH45967.1 type IV pilus assembly PilZ [Thermodesulfatator indicus DSM 15286]
MLDKRVFERFELKCSCHFVVEDSYQVLDARIEDISLGGFRISTFTSLSPGMRIKFSLETDPPIKGRAKVVWVRKDGEKYYAGLEIVELKEKFRKPFREIIEELTLNNLPGSYFR